MRTLATATAVTASAAIAGLGLTGSLSGPPSARAAQAQRPPFAAQDPGAACFWSIPVNATTINKAYPDADATYWPASFVIPAGDRLQLVGRFPHSRFASLTTYDAGGAPVGTLSDYQINPAAGSINPFRPGRPRTAPHRSFAVTLSPATPTAPLNPDQTSAEPASNTIDTTPVGALGGAGYILWRVYVPDQGDGLSGGVGLPTPVLTTAVGQRLTGPAACQALQANRNPPAQGSQAISPTLYDQLRYQPGKPPWFPATKPAQWRVQYNRAYLLALYTGQRIPHPSKTGQSGFFPNPANQYARAAINRRLGKVVALRGRLATTPRTYHHNRTMGVGQLRYESFCMNESILTTRVMDCAYDQQIPTDRHHRFVVVTSRAADRPSNATRRCGVAWINWSRAGDGGRDHDFGWMQIRTMLPRPSFHHAVQSTRHPGDQSRVMGPYLPKIRYYADKTAFEKLGCPVGSGAR